VSIVVDLNSDVGESFGNYKIGLDEEVLKYVSSVNIACGWHAGDPVIMDKTIDIAIKNKLGIGAHPGYPDLMGFGRRKMDISLKEARNYTIYQLGALKAFAESKKYKIQHIKLHGAFYNFCSVNYDMAKEVAKGIYDVDKDIIVMGLAGSLMIKAARDVGLKSAEEVFADRAYNADGTLVSRKFQGAVIEDKNLAIQRVIRMVQEGKVKAINGEDINIKADSICVHGDNPEALEFVKLIKRTLEDNNVSIKPLKEFIK
jgi:UPF0271 protein